MGTATNSLLVMALETRKLKRIGWLYPIFRDPLPLPSAVRGKSRHRTVSLDRSMSYGLFCPGTI